MAKPTVTLGEELADLRRELGMRRHVYAQQLHQAGTDPRRRAELETKHNHQLACTQATIARLEALLPQQLSLL